MSASEAPTAWEIVRAAETLKAAGFLFSPPQNVAIRIRLYTFAEAAEMTGLQLTWWRRHQGEFPHLTKPPGSPLRITLADIEAAIKRWRVNGEGSHDSSP
jgi:hypothetical protein